MYERIWNLCCWTQHLYNLKIPHALLVYCARLVIVLLDVQLQNCVDFMLYMGLWMACGW